MSNIIEKPLCLVRGAIAPRAMCGWVIVGAKFCGYAGECQHKQEQPIVATAEKDQA